MTPEDMEKTLTYLLDRQEIYDLMARYCRGVDRLDKDLVLSCYHEDALDDHAMFVGNREEFWRWVEPMHAGSQSSTQHLIGNHLAEIDGNVAHAETYYSFGGMNREGAPFTYIGGRYIDRLEKRDGKWGIVERFILNDWIAPSINTVEGSQTPEGQTNYGNIDHRELAIMDTAPKGSRDRNDPVYARPLRVAPERVERYKSAVAAPADTTAELAPS